jgi:hypothetical protein
MQDYSNISLRQWQQIQKDVRELIVQASAIDGSDSWQPFPIGMSWQYPLHVNKQTQIGSHHNTVLCAISSTTDMQRRGHTINRQRIINTLSQNSINNKIIDSATYFTSLPSYKFVVSPEGNGIDCHRHYEALLAGCIPIMEYNPLIEEKYKGCPILYTTDYSEINETYLNDKYEQMLDTMYNFSCLFMQHYSKEHIAAIKDCGNYWLRRTCGITWY